MGDGPEPVLSLEPRQAVKGSIRRPHRSRTLGSSASLSSAIQSYGKAPDNRERDITLCHSVVQARHSEKFRQGRTTPPVYEY